MIVQKNLLLFIIFFISMQAYSATTVCSSDHGGYCTYTGKVQRLYVNENNIILMYFEESIAPEEIAKTGVTVSHGDAAGYNISFNPEFAKMFYSTALAAQISNREVSIQMSGSLSGYLQLNRIWINSTE